jgi:hypothetical protein
MSDAARRGGIRSAEHIRLEEARTGSTGDWKFIGPYLSERAWGTVREDYSANGNAWGTSHSIMRARARTAGVRMVLRESAIVRSVCALRSPFGTAAPRS